MLDKHFEQFLTEKQYLKNSSPATLTYLRYCYKAWKRFTGDCAQAEAISQAICNQFVIEIDRKSVV